MPVPRRDADTFREAARELRTAEVRLFRLAPDASEADRDRIIAEYLDARRAFDAAGLAVATLLKKRWN